MIQKQIISDICPICQSSLSAQYPSCFICGYNKKSEEILNYEKLRSYISSIPKENWPLKITAKKNVFEVQLKKHGPSSTNPEKGGWSITKTAQLLGETTPTTSVHINLAEALDKYPKLKSCKNIRAAKKCLSEIQKGGKLPNGKSNIEFEKDLQSYIKENWDKTPFSPDWSLQRTGMFDTGKYNTGEVGEMDFLARHRNEPRWLVIELKLHQSSDETVGQILRYMGWIMKNHAQEGEEVEGVIITKSADINIRYALLCVPNVRLKIYKLSNGKLEFEDSERFYLRVALNQLSPEDRLKLIEELKVI